MNVDYINKEHELHLKAEAEMRALYDAAAAESRVLSAEEQAQFDRWEDESEKREKTAKSLLAMEQRASEFSDLVGRLTIPTPGSGTASGRPAGLEAQLLENIRTVQQSFKRNGSFDSELWAMGMIDVEKRAIADFSDNGALYTTDFATRVAIYQRTASPWINLATVINADNGRPLNLPNETVDGTVYTPGESTAITESTPTIGSAALTTTAYKALGYVSVEAEEDELIGLLQLISKTQGRAIGFQFGTALSASILTAATNGGTATPAGGNGTAAPTFLGYEDLIDLQMSAPAPYRTNGVGAYVASNGAIKKMKKFKDQQGNYFWNSAGRSGEPNMFDGFPVYEDPGLAAPASATKSVLFGDVSAVVIKQMALRVATSTEFKFSNDQIAIKTVYRAGGALPDAIALRYLVSSNA